MGILSKLFGPSHRVVPTAVRSLDSFRREVLESDVPVIVDVWSESCAPCRQLVPVLVDVATRHEGRVRVAEIAADPEPALLSRLQVRATPTLIIFEGGQGARPRQRVPTRIVVRRDDRGGVPEVAA